MATPITAEITTSFRTLRLTISVVGIPKQAVNRLRLLEFKKKTWCFRRRQARSSEEEVISV